MRCAMAIEVEECNGNGKPEAGVEIASEMVSRGRGAGKRRRLEAAPFRSDAARGTRTCVCDAADGAESAAWRQPGVLGA